MGEVLWVLQWETMIRSNFPWNDKVDYLADCQNWPELIALQYIISYALHIQIGWKIKVIGFCNNQNIQSLE